MRMLFLGAMLVLLVSCSENSNVSRAVTRQKQSLPKPVNSFITWTDVQLAGQVIESTYLVDEQKLSIPLAVALVELRTAGKTNILKGIRENPQLKVFIESGHTFRYLYRDGNGKLLHEFTVGRQDLTNPPVE